MNFEDENIRDEAAQKSENVEQVSAKSMGKSMPKVMISNVHKEETGDKMIEAYETRMSSFTRFQVLREI